MKKHIHNFETITHHGVTNEAIENGIQAAEVRRCKKCQKEVLFLENRKGQWFPLFEEEESNEKEILLA